jgi:hypothetical protein
MAMNRRQFLLGTAAGLVLPSFFDRALAYFENHGEPLIEAPRRTAPVMYACAELSGWEGYQMTIGDPWSQPPPMTVSEFCKRYGKAGPQPNWMEGWTKEVGGELDMNAEVDRWMVIDHWGCTEAPHCLAHEYLQSIDLGPKLAGATAVGELRTEVGATDYVGTHATDEVTLSLLQNRLNELNSGMRIVVC